MNYKEFTELLRPLDHLYNVVRISDHSSILRGASKKSAEEIIERVGKNNIEIYIY